MSFRKVYLSVPMKDDGHKGDVSKLVPILEVTAPVIYNPFDVKWGETRFAEFKAEGFRSNISNLVDSDAVFLIGDWKNARGCIAEVLNAALFGCKIYELDVTKTLETNRPSLTVVGIDRSNVNTHIAELLTNQESSSKPSA